MARLSPVRYRFAAIAFLILCGLVATAAVPAIDVVRVPSGGIQPRAVAGTDGTMHLLFFRGEPQAGNLYYAKRIPGQRAWSEPLRVNSEADSAVAIGTIRGGRIALAPDGRVHVAWNGSGKAAADKAAGSPMLYTRLNDTGSAFEPQRNLMTHTTGLDGGGALAIDAKGIIYVTWHGLDKSAQSDEASRTVWIARSSDHGASFRPETNALTTPTGACGCCGLDAFAGGPDGALRILYRTATNQTGRDMVLLTATGPGKPMSARAVDPWQINQCVMSMPAFAANSTATIAAWETKGQVLFQSLLTPGTPITPPGKPAGRKYPAIAVNAENATLLAWTEGAGWNRAGTIHWQLFSPNGQPVPELTGSRSDSPVWNFPATVTTPTGDFLLIY